MALDDPKTLVSTDWLAAHMRDPDLRIIDASWYMPAEGRDARAEYDAGHIPGARFFDIDEISDARSSLAHMAPSTEKFMSRMRAMGIGDGHQVVVYDGAGIFSAPRVWWLFRLMGQMNIAVLDGGMAKWVAEGREVEDLPPVIRDRHMMVRFQNQMVKDATQVAAAAKLGNPQIVDARSPARFTGAEADPRPGLRAGRIPGSRNVFYKDLLNEDATLKDPAALKAAFEAGGVDLGKPVITTCGSGITACILALALERLGKSDHAVYDGSWNEWGAAPTMPIETGEA